MDASSMSKSPTSIQEDVVSAVTTGSPDGVTNSGSSSTATSTNPGQGGDAHSQTGLLGGKNVLDSRDPSKVHDDVVTLPRSISAGGSQATTAIGPGPLPHNVPAGSTHSSGLVSGTNGAPPSSAAKSRDTTRRSSEAPNGKTVSCATTEAEPGSGPTVDAMSGTDEPVSDRKEPDEFDHEMRQNFKAVSGSKLTYESGLQVGIRFFKAHLKKTGPYFQDPAHLEANVLCEIIFEELGLNTKEERASPLGYDVVSGWLPWLFLVKRVAMYRYNRHWRKDSSRNWQADLEAPWKILLRGIAKQNPPHIPT